MKEVLLKEYSNLKKLNIISKEGDYTFNLHFIEGAFLEIIGDKAGKFKVEFYNQLTGALLYTDTITNNMWCKASTKYYVKWLIRVTDTESNQVIFTHEFNAQGKRVYIHLDSKALGDTLAWFPQVEEFRKQHDCEVICSTFHNDWFETTYPEIEFTNPGSTVHNLYAMYGVGWYYNEDENIDFTRNPIDFRIQSLIKTSSDILGLEFNEVRPNLSFKDKGKTIEGKYVCIAPHGSSHAKYWNREGGWQEVIDYLNLQGYKVVMITSEPLGNSFHDKKLGGTLKGVIDKTGDIHLSDRANDLRHADAFIGIGSGLSWLSWAVGCPTTLISGFSEAYSEFEDCQRISPPKDKCSGCFNITRLNAGDWEWCPEHKNSPRHFECTKSIHPETVIDAINLQLEITP